MAIVAKYYFISGKICHLKANSEQVLVFSLELFFMKKSLSLFIFVAIIYAIYSHYNAFKEIKILDISQPQTITLIAKNKMVYGLEAYIEGHLDDTANIGAHYIGKGQVNTSLYSGDY